MRRPDPHRALIRALAARFPGLDILHSQSESWASATFIGARHCFTCAGGADLCGIGEKEFALPGHLVADIEANWEGEEQVIAALTIEID